MCLEQPVLDGEEGGRAPRADADLLKQALVVMMDGEEIGSGSIVWGDGNRAYLCLEITEKLRQKPIFMVKTAKALINAALEAGVELFAFREQVVELVLAEHRPKGLVATPKKGPTHRSERGPP